MFHTLSGWQMFVNITGMLPKCKKKCAKYQTYSIIIKHKSSPTEKLICSVLKN